MLSFHEALSKLKSPSCEPCRHWFSASFIDDVEYDRLEDWYIEALAVLTVTDGTPVAGPPLPGVDIERCACWRRGDASLYAVLSWGDNTRIRILTVGVCYGDSLADGIMKPGA